MAGKITEQQRKYALIIANARRSHHLQAGTYTGLWHKRFDILNEFYGILGELAFAAETNSNNILTQAAPIYTANTDLLPTYDFLIGGKTFELKTTPPQSNYVRFMVNTKSFKNQDYYISIKLHEEDNVIVSYSIMGMGTGDWVSWLPIRDFGEGDAYYTYLEQMPIKDVWSIVK